MHLTRISRLAAALAASVLVIVPAVAQDEEAGEEKTWTDTAELSLVGTDGNSESLTFGFRNEFTKSWAKSLLTITVAGIRAETTNTTRTAEDDDPNAPPPPRIIETEDTETTAETYLFRGRYERNITDRFLWYGAINWDRNRPAGVENRYTYVAGVGNIWYDTDELKFKTGYAVTYTDQEDVVDNPDQGDTFAGLRFSWDYLNQFTETTTYENILVVDQNLDETDDLRATMGNNLTVTMSERLALKAGLAFLYDAEPSFEDVTVVNTNPPPADFGTVPVQLDELDTILSISLVVNF